jgi:alkylation response protein AidB-like acyl-CoA dehydrogenase
VADADSDLERASPLADLDDRTRQLIERAAATGEDVDAALQLASAVGDRLPLPGGGRTRERWAVLAALGRSNLTVARVTEAHTDAVAILAEAGTPLDRDGTWGVFAAEAPGRFLKAELTAGGWTVTGTKPWCSLADRLDHALVTAHVADGRRLFRIDLHHPRVRVEPARGWVARGLRTVTSVAIDCDAVPAEPVGDTGWYLTRDGFAWGGIGVAACWYGGAAGLADRLHAVATHRHGGLDRLHVGAVDVALHAAAATLTAAAQRIDGGDARGAAGELLAYRVRAVVADAAEQVLRQVGHALGPAPLAFDADHAARVADLELYIRQHHAERDLAALGALLLPESQ